MADLAIAKSAPATATSGTDITYSLTVTNNGPSTSSGGTVTDVLPAQVSFVSAGAGCTNTAGTVSCSVGALTLSATQTFTIVVHINPAATGPIANTATVTATNSLEDTSAANNAAVATTTAQRVADLAITKSAPDTATSGTNITYHLVVTNNGPSISSGGTVTDVLPAQVSFVSASAGCTNTAGTVTCNFGTLVPSSSVSFDIVVHMSVVTTGAVTNTASVRGNDTDTSPANNTAPATTVVSPQTTPGKVTGGGVIDVPGGKANFGFVAQRKTTGGPVSGNLNYLDHASGRHVHGPITSLTIIGNSAEFAGSCGPSCTFYVAVQDNGEPGAGKDMFNITVTASPPYTVGGTIRSGNIQVHGDDLPAPNGSAVSCAGEGIFPAGSTFNGVPLNGVHFGSGVGLPGDSSAAGDFQALLLGTSLLGQPQNINVVGRASSGSVNADGTTTFLGLGTVEMGNGTPPLTGVPFSVTATTQGLRIILGSTALPAATLTAGSITPP